MEHEHTPCTPEMVIAGCLQGIFPMVDPETGDLGWYDPDPRAVIPLDKFHVPRSLDRVVQSERFEVSCDRDFESVIRSCAAPRPEADDTWIDDRIINCYLELHHRGQAHSIEARRDGVLVAGLYGVSIGGAFFGESMFSDPQDGRDGSKVCLVHLVERLRRGGFLLLDVQFSTPHLIRFGCESIPRSEYQYRLATALVAEADWGS
ncbi:MAG: leucyl/phenylalanyl-tRNA--protein transferase [Phycisphaerales bacterium]|nr:leucyl/phenylalanyl-tRNA--protein transferase [Phycisphaerales bacterium]